jgi:hypothetical protein
MVGGTGLAIRIKNSKAGTIHGKYTTAKRLQTKPAPFLFMMNN